LSQQSDIKIEKAITTLSEMEQEIETIKLRISEIKREILSYAQEESDDAKNTALTIAHKKVEKSISKVKSETEKDAKTIVEKGEKDLILLRKQIDKSFAKAVTLVVNAVSGD